jgi:hypothetical protein
LVIHNQIVNYSWEAISDVLSSLIESEKLDFLVIEMSQSDVFSCSDKTGTRTVKTACGQGAVDQDGHSEFLTDDVCRNDSNGAIAVQVLRASLK